MLRGEIHVPGDKSITHRAFLFGAMAQGTTRVLAPLRAEDTDNTLRAVGALGPVITDNGEEVLIAGGGCRSFVEPAEVLDLGNSGTGVRLLAGLLASCPFHSVLTGDGSLRKRPMGRVVDPLRRMGAAIDGRADGTLLPLSIRGKTLRGISYESPVASAQVKSCVIIGALRAEGTTTFSEPALSRDHTERMLGAMGVRIQEEDGCLTIEGGQEPAPCTVHVPGDISSAAFFLVAGAVLEGSDITVRNVGINPTRTGILELLEAMGAHIEVTPLEGDGEPRGDVRERWTGSLNGISIPEEWIPRIIDELPLAGVLASVSEGMTELRGAGELRVKESDRISTTVQMLKNTGAKVEELADGFRVYGPTVLSRAVHESHGDHRIAMSSAILSLLAKGESEVRGTACVATSFPGFTGLMNHLRNGCVVEPGRE